MRGSAGPSAGELAPGGASVSLTLRCAGAASRSAVERRCGLSARGPGSRCAPACPPRPLALRWARAVRDEPARARRPAPAGGSRRRGRRPPPRRGRGAGLHHTITIHGSGRRAGALPWAAAQHRGLPATARDDRPPRGWRVATDGTRRFITPARGLHRPRGHRHRWPRPPRSGHLVRVATALRWPLRAVREWPPERRPSRPVATGHVLRRGWAPGGAGWPPAAPGAGGRAGVARPGRAGPPPRKGRAPEARGPQLHWTTA